MSMMPGVESIGVYVGRTAIGVRELFEHRGLDLGRFDNLMMTRRSVNLPCEDPVTNAVNAARPILDTLPASERERIEAVVVGTESGLDFGKPISTYVHDHLGLSRRCRSFEVKHACYGGTAALRTSLGLLAGSPDPDAKALVIAADAGGDVTDMPYWEPSHGAGAVALLLGRDAGVLELDHGAYGLDTHEVMDTCRPLVDHAAGDADLSVLAYLEAMQRCVADYCQRVEGADIIDTFDYLAMHTPFAGLVKGAHRQLVRRIRRWPAERIEEDFAVRVSPSLEFSRLTGNTYAASLFIGLASLLENGDFSVPRRVGLFSYGSGCAAEFYSGVVGIEAPGRLVTKVGDALESRYPLNMAEYDVLMRHGQEGRAGVRDARMDLAPYQDVYEASMAGRGLLVLDGVEGFHRRYRWS